MNLPLQLQSFLGLLALCLLCWVMGGCRRGVRPRVVLAGLAGMLAIAAVMLHVPPIRAGFALVGSAVDALARATRAGTALVFGYLGGGPLPFQEAVPGSSFILFFQALPLVLVVGALSALLFHWRVLPFIVRLLASGLQRLFGIGGAAGFAVAANVFVGMVEAPLLIRAWLARLTRAEMFVVMVAGLATISGNTLVVYALIISPVVPGAAGQLLTASLVAAPASVLAALLMIPGDAGTDAETTAMPSPYASSMEALVQGTADGLQLLLGIMAALIVFVALVALMNEILQPLLGVTLQQAAGWLLKPLALAMGVPWSESAAVGASLGTKLVINEFVAYLGLAAEGGALSERTRLILAYALCGFANFGSVGIMLGGMSTLCPERRADIVALGLPSLACATVACCLSGAAVGVLTAP
ncbi:MAG: nucleoside:proton symporter [Acetobacteraceae bacterium]|nr:nucleoside:proton symporter [Acetobacteraceae bacterium]